VLPLSLFAFKLVKMVHLYRARVGANVRQALAAAREEAILMVGLWFAAFAVSRIPSFDGDLTGLIGRLARRSRRRCAEFGDRGGIRT